MFDLTAVQTAIRQFQFDGWLLCDFRGSNTLAQRILQIPDDVFTSRRFFYFIPAEGSPQKLVHRIENDVLDHLPGEKNVYLRWQELEAGIESLVNGCGRLAMEYSPRNANPYISRVDGGTIELVKACGCDVQSSGDLVSLFESTLTAEQLESHYAVSKLTDAAFGLAWQFIADKVRQNGRVKETAVRDVIMQHFHDNRLVTHHPPIVGVNENGGNPHYDTGQGQNTDIAEHDFVLIDLWAKQNIPGAVYSDLTRTGFVGTEVPAKYTDVFQIVAAARDAGIRCVTEAFAQKKPLQGYEVDDAVRSVIEEAGYGDFFCHRTGHSMGLETHGNGAHLDNLETHETRLILPQTLFTIEPGIYLPEFGIRSEVDIYVHADERVEVTGGPVQTEVVRILAEY